MNHLLRILNLIVSSEIQRKLYPEDWAKRYNNLTSKDELYLHYFRAFLMESDFVRRHSFYCRNFAPYQLLTSHHPQFHTSYQPSPLPPPIVHTPHPNAPAQFMIIPPLVPEDLFTPSFPTNPINNQYTRPDARRNRKAISVCIPKPVNEVNISKRNTRKHSFHYDYSTKRNIDSTLNPSTSISSCLNEIKSVALRCPPIAPALSNTSLPISSPTNKYTSNIVTRINPQISGSFTRSPGTLEHNSYPFDTTVSNMIPASCSTSTSAPSLI